MKKASFEKARNYLRRFTLGAMLLAMAQPTWAFTLATFAEGWKSEAGTILPAVLLITAGIGVVIAGFATISGIMAKKNQQPLQWQLWGIIGGGLAVVIPAFILATSGSLTSENGNAEDVLSELSIDY